MKKSIITIDGPAASGKEKISKYISRKLNFKHLDSGLFYRRLALVFLNHNIDLNNPREIKKKIVELNNIPYKKTKNIRTQEISRLSSKIAVHSFVRVFINKQQRNFVQNNKSIQGFVIDGRDIGSVVFKRADLKLYIDVDAKIRAKRRYKQLIDSGEKSIYPQILKEIKLRDKKDKLRRHSPLVIPKDAYILDNNGKFNNTVKQINKLLTKI